MLCFFTAPQPNLSTLPPMPQTKNGRKKWRKKQRNLMEAALANQANQSTQISPNLYHQRINFVPPVPFLQLPPTPKTTVTNSYPFTPIVPSTPPPSQQLHSSLETQIPQKKQNSFDLPDNCPSSLR